MITNRRWPARGAAIIAGGAACFVMLGASLVAAHPLGNFSVNHSHNLSLEPQLIIDRAIVDFAEIPTAQSEGQVDTDGDGADLSGRTRRSRSRAVRRRWCRT